MKKRYSLIILGTVLLLTGCGSRSSFPIDFDGFTIKFYDNKKEYINTSVDTSIEGVVLLKEMKELVVEGDTGFVNSYIILKTALYSGADFQKIVDENNKKYTIKLLNYKSLKSEAKKIKCDDRQYSGYLMTFAYQLDMQTLYGGQYFLADETSLYLLSLASDEEKDIDRFLKSTKKIDCKKTK